MDKLATDIWNYLVSTASETLGYKALIVLGLLLALLILVVPGRKISDRAALAALAAFLTLVFASTVLFRTTASGASGAHNFVPFYTWSRAITLQSKTLLLQNIENIALYIPAGIALGWLCRDAKGWECAIAICGVVLFSVAIEFLQLHYGIGMCDIDDVIDNALGTVIGFFMLWGIYKLVRRKKPSSPELTGRHSLRR